MRWWMGMGLGLLLSLAPVGSADDRRGSPFGDDHWQGYRTWRPERRDQRRYRQHLPDQFTIDKPGKCEVICQRVGREYQCREYRC
jgi:hypothetical protein